jgi:hypothetical protein
LNLPGRREFKTFVEIGDGGFGSMSVRLAGAVLAAGAALALPATAAAGAREQVNQALGLFGPHIPDVLQRAKADPYAPPPAPECATVPKEIAQLDALLGPDIDQPKPKTIVPTNLIGHAVRSAIPYRSAIRFVTGADRKQKRLEQATKAGWARRGFLKGLAARMDCDAHIRVTSAPLTIPPPRILYPPPAPIAVPAAPDLNSADGFEVARGRAATVNP